MKNNSLRKANRRADQQERAWLARHKKLAEKKANQKERVNAAWLSIMTKAPTLCGLSHPRICHINIGSSPTATAANAKLGPGVAEYFAVTPGQKFAAIRTTTSGSLFVTEVS